MISTKLNKDITTAVPIGEVLPEMKPGLYVVRAWPENSKYGSNRGSTQWFIISDIGLSTLKAQNGLYGFVRSITSAEPMTNVSIRLLARNNEVLGTAKSDAKGMVHFEGGLLRGKVVTGQLSSSLMVPKVIMDLLTLRKLPLI